jgi:hypothetical protein
MTTFIHVAGTSHTNPDDTSRQAILGALQEGDPITLEPEPSNPYDIFAIRVLTSLGCIGYVPAAVAKQMPRPLRTTTGNIYQLFGGHGEKATRGCKIVIEG